VSGLLGCFWLKGGRFLREDKDASANSEWMDGTGRRSPPGWEKGSQRRCCRDSEGNNPARTRLCLMESEGCGGVSILRAAKEQRTSAQTNAPFSPQLLSTHTAGGQGAGVASSHAGAL
jgi:hypothetical protein